MSAKCDLYLLKFEEEDGEMVEWFDRCGASAPGMGAIRTITMQREIAANPEKGMPKRVVTDRRKVRLCPEHQKIKEGFFFHHGQLTIKALT